MTTTNPCPSRSLSQDLSFPLGGIFIVVVVVAVSFVMLLFLVVGVVRTISILSAAFVKF